MGNLLAHERLKRVERTPSYMMNHGCHRSMLNQFSSRYLLHPQPTGTEVILCSASLIIYYRTLLIFEKGFVIDIKLLPFDLLKEVGRDCVGAIQLLPPEEIPDAVDALIGRNITDKEVAQILKGSTGNQSMQVVYQDEFRISLAGAQEKTACLCHNGSWKILHGTTPTTHIPKLPLGNVGTIKAAMPLSVENEWLFSKLTSAFGLNTTHCEIAEFDAVETLAGYPTF